MNYKHGMEATPFYSKFISLRARCRNPKNKKYFGKGIKCQWNNFIDFKNDMFASYLIHFARFGKRQTTIDRIDPLGDYSKQNCRWATFKEQRVNQKRMRMVVFNGKSQTIKDWSKELGVGGGTIQWRLSRGWPVKMALSKKHFNFGRNFAFVGDTVALPVSKRGRPKNSLITS